MSLILTLSVFYRRRATIAPKFRIRSDRKFARLGMNMNPLKKIHQAVRPKGFSRLLRNQFVDLDVSATLFYFGDNLRPHFLVHLILDFFLNFLVDLFGNGMPFLESEYPQY